MFGGFVAFKSAILVLSKSIVHDSSHVACPVEDLVKFIGILVPPILIGTFTTFVVWVAGADVVAGELIAFLYSCSSFKVHLPSPNFDSYTSKKCLNDSSDPFSLSIASFTCFFSSAVP